MNDRASESDIERRLTALEAASDARRAELRAVLDDLPAALSRRALVRAAAVDLRRAPGKVDVVRRGANKVARTVRAGVVRRPSTDR
ncbi:MAG: hypothetical protein ABJH68_14225 [Ilumatobacter sp.]|uniref:hypothetical protein n=1 Tax=Ilumatobacter sp. TaxID=1967498 RepID=UPI0032986A70